MSEKEIERLEKKMGEDVELWRPCKRCGEPNPDWKEWKWCPDCREALADALTSAKFTTTSADQVESKKGGWLETRRK